MALLSKHLSHLITTCADKMQFPDQSLVKPFYERVQQRPSQDCYYSLRSGTHHVGVFRDASGPFMGLGGSRKLLRLPTTTLFRQFGDSAADDLKFSSGKYISILYWDPLLCFGRYVINPNAPKGHFKVPLSQIEHIIVCAHRATLGTPKVHKFLENNIPVKSWIRNGTFNVSSYPTVGCDLNSKKCQLLWQAMLSQTFDRWRQPFLKPFTPLVYNHPIWHTTIETSASLRKQTILGYISTISVFCAFSSLTTEEVFTQLANNTLDVEMLRKWLNYRVNSLEVAVETAVGDISAFSWFLKKLTNKSFKDTWPGLKDHVYSLRKRLGGTKYASDSLNFRQFVKVMKEILKYDWGNWDPQDVYDAALISTWGCLRISELIGCSHLTTSIHKAKCDMLRINVYDAKTAIKNKIQFKDCSRFENHPELCAIEAYKRLKAKSKTGKLFRDQDGKPWTTDQLHKKFSMFTGHCKANKTLPSGKFTWHMWRITFLNISYAEMDVPINHCQNMASHRNLQSTHHYVDRTTSTRKRKIVAAVGEKANRFISSKKRKLSKPTSGNQTLSEILKQRLEQYK